MEGPRSPSQNEMLEVMSFLDKALRPDKSWSIQNEYPTAFNATNIHNIKIISDDTKIISHAVLKPILVRTPQVNLKVAAIGSVVTDSTYRNQGLSKKILEDCLSEAEAQGCEIAILWSNLYDFYRKLGFELAGSEISLTLENFPLIPSGDLRFLDTTKVSPEAILKLYNQHTVNSVRSVEDVRKFMSIPNTEIFTAWDAQNNLQAYAIMGKGADLTGYIHEWGGGVSKLLPLFSYIKNKKKVPITIISPSYSVNLISALKHAGAFQTDGYLGMMKVTHEFSLFQKITRAAKSLGINNFILERTEAGVIIGTSESNALIENEATLIQCLFGPSYSRDLIKLNEQSHKQIEKLLPLGFWIWGWDSI